MELIQGIKNRRSIRKFLDKPVSHDIINEIVEVASYAPSWKNTQVTRYNVIEDKDIIARIGKECVLDFSFNEKTMNRASAIVLVTYVKGISGYEKDGSFTTPREDKWETFDAGLATQTFCLAAFEKGIGTVILGIFDENKVKTVVKLPDNEDIAAIIAMGYPDATPSTPARKSTEELVRFIK